MKSFDGGISIKVKALEADLTPLSADSCHGHNVVCG